VYDRAEDELAAAHAAGENASHFSSIRIAMGQRLSGWVAANRQTILNSDPMLDLGEVARVLKPALRSCLSTPLLVDRELVGVLTVYSTHREAFSEDHRRIVEVVARQVSETVNRAIGFRQEQTEKLRDQLTGLPNRQHLERFVTTELTSAAGLPCSILLIDVSAISLRQHQRPAVAGAIARLSELIRLGLRGADLLFTYDAGRFVALLTQTDASTGDALMRRVANEIGRFGSLEDSTFEGAAVRIGRASAPEDGSSLTQLVKVAENRSLPPSSLTRPSVH
jgi:diguanylate cyclase (GGDEF)-like protein